MKDWAHGYNVEVPYTYGFYRETSPLWLKWATLVGGRKPPKAGKLRVLELGCGQGFNLCIHAAANPKMEFLGIDFNPSHVAHGEELARLANLSNIRFAEGDFVELQNHWPSDYGSFHFVILHGIWSWVSKPVREAILNIIKKVLLPGGIVYISYNALPGWLSGVILREILLSYGKIRELPSTLVVKEAFELAKRLEQAGSAVYRVYPGLKSRLELISKQDTHYLVHEFLHEVHGLFWVHEVIEEVLEGKLYYTASATLSENYLPSLLPQDAKNLINQFSHPVFRLFLLDLFINQSFRRDIFQKGVIEPSPLERIREARAMRFIAVEEPPSEFKFNLAFGEVEGKKEIYSPLMAEFSQRPKSIEELLKVEALRSVGLAGLIQAISLLTEKGFLAPYNEDHDISHTVRFNRTVTRLVSEGRNYLFLASPLTGLGISLSFLEMLMVDSLFDGGKSFDEVLLKTYEKLNLLGRRLLKDGRELTDEKEAKEFLRGLLGEFMEKRLPKLKALRVI